MVTLKAAQSDANQRHEPASYTWDAINNMGQQLGTPDIDFDSFSARYDSDPVIQGMVDNFDKSGVVLKTQFGQEQQPMQQQATQGKAMMSQAASRATKKATGI